MPVERSSSPPPLAGQGPHAEHGCLHYWDPPLPPSPPLPPVLPPVLHAQPAPNINVAPPVPPSHSLAAHPASLGLRELIEDKVRAQLPLAYMQLEVRLHQVEHYHRVFYNAGRNLRTSGRANTSRHADPLEPPPWLDAVSANIPLHTGMCSIMVQDYAAWHHVQIATANVRPTLAASVVLASAARMSLAAMDALGTLTAFQQSQHAGARAALDATGTAHPIPAALVDLASRMTSAQRQKYNLRQARRPYENRLHRIDFEVLEGDRWATHLREEVERSRRVLHDSRAWRQSLQDHEATVRYEAQLHQEQQLDWLFTTNFRS